MISGGSIQYMRLMGYSTPLCWSWQCPYWELNNDRYWSQSDWCWLWEWRCWLRSQYMYSLLTPSSSSSSCRAFPLPSPHNRFQFPLDGKIETKPSWMSFVHFMVRLIGEEWDFILFPFPITNITEPFHSSQCLMKVPWNGFFVIHECQYPVKLSIIHEEIKSLASVCVCWCGVVVCSMV